MDVRLTGNKGEIEMEFISFMMVMIVIYFVPSLVAELRHHHNAMAILVANIFFGWTVIGWIICLIWAVTAVRWPVERRRKPR